MSFTTVSCLEFGIENTIELLNLAFIDYIIPVEFSPARFMSMLRYDGIDADASRVVLQGDKPAGVGLVARRGWANRLAGMAVVPDLRRIGAGRYMVTTILDEARSRGDRIFELEVIEENLPAVNLYTSIGFTHLRRLTSYTSSDLTVQAQEVPVEVDIQEAARMVIIHGLPDLPWQLTGESLVHLGPPNRAYNLGGAWMVITDPGQPQVAVRAMVVQPSARGQGLARCLLKSVMAAFPGVTWSVPAICPLEIGGFFEACGFTEGTLSQLQMRISLQAE
jgi:GNAT superfamily N-acetyltransferase